MSILRADGLEAALPAHHVDVTLRAGAFLGVVVIEVERVRLWLLEIIDDVARLRRALIDTVLHA